MGKSDLGIFKREFLRQIQVLGLLSYDYYFSRFEHGENMAEVSVDIDARSVNVRLNTSKKIGYRAWKHLGYRSKLEALQDLAAHESAHVLLGEIRWLAHARFTDEGQLFRAEEAVVVVLTRLLRPLASYKPHADRPRLAHNTQQFP
jgi:hypothetical protein